MRKTLLLVLFPLMAGFSGVSSADVFLGYFDTQELLDIAIGPTPGGYGLRGNWVGGYGCPTPQVPVAVMGFTYRDSVQYCGFVAQSCPLGTFRENTGACAAACPTNPAISGTDPMCLQECPAGQFKSGDNCYKDCSNAASKDIGKADDFAWVITGQNSCSGTIIDNGCFYNVNPANCKCGTISAGGISSTTCYQWGVFTPNGSSLFMGAAPGVSNPAAPPPDKVRTDTAGPVHPDSSGPPNVPPGCPAGFSFDSSSGLCVAPGTPGTPSTPTTPSTPAEPSRFTCPIGYHVNGMGCQANNPGPPISGSCPPGFTPNASGLCLSQPNPNLEGANGKNKDQTGTLCGGAGQPACRSSLGKDGVLDSIQKTLGDAFGTDGMMSTGFKGIREVLSGESYSGATGMSEASGHYDDRLGKVTGITSDTPDHGWSFGWSNLGLSPVQCEPFKIQTGTWVMPLDICPVAAKIRELGGYVLYVVTAFGLFNILTRTEA